MQSGPPVNTFSAPGTGPGIRPSTWVGLVRSFACSLAAETVALPLHYIYSKRCAYNLLGARVSASPNGICARVRSAYTLLASEMGSR